MHSEPPVPLDALLARYRATGDPQAFASLFDATAGVLFRVALTLVRDPHAAEDALQQTYLVALRKLARLGPGRPIMPWLLNVLVKEAATVNRSLRRRPDADRLASRGLPSTTEPIEGRDSREALERAISTLDEPYRSAALLRWRYGLEPAEVAHVRGEPPGTTRSILSRAMERLRGPLRALSAVFLGEEAAGRGLDGVRACTMRAARDAALRPLGTTATTAGTVITGALLMKKAAIVVGCLLVLLFAGRLAFAPGSEGPGPAAAPPAGAPPREAATLAALPHRPPGADGASPAAIPASAVPPGADAPIEGIVTSSDGHPVPRASIYVYAHDRDVLLELDSARPDPGVSTASTASDGRFSVPRPDLPRVALVVIARGYATGYVAPVVAGSRPRIVLHRSGSIRGRVLGLDGRPIAAARVALYVLLDAFHTARHAVSAADGTYRIEDVPNGSTGRLPQESRLVAEADGHARQVLDPAHLRLPLRPGEETEINLVLTKGARLEGRVLDAAGGSPVAGARVLLWTFDGLFRLRGLEHPADPFRLGEAVTGTDGRYRFDGVPCEGFFRSPSTKPSLVTGRPIGAWVAAAKEGRTTAVHEVALADEGATLSIDLVVEPAFSVRGRVVDADGRPVVGAQVWAMVLRNGVLSPISPSLRSAFPTEFGATGPDGSYRLDGIALPRAGDPPFFVGAQSSEQRFRRPDGSTEVARLDVPGPYAGVREAPDLVLTARHVPWARVRVLDGAGRPVSDAAVAWSSTGSTERTDSEGRARLESPDPGPTDRANQRKLLYVHGAGFAVTRAEAFLSQVPGQEPEETVVTLAAGHRLKGRVATSGGALPPDTRVSVGNGDLPLGVVFPIAAPAGAPYVPFDPALWREYGSVTIDADGSFVIDDLPVGPYHVLVRAPQPGSRASGPGADATVSSRSNVPTDAEIELVLPIGPERPTRTLELRVLEADSDAPVLHPTGELVRGGDRTPGHAVEPGVLRFERVELGTWSFRGGGEGFDSVTVDGLDVTEGSDAKGTVIRVRRGLRLVGVVTGPGGAPFVGQVVIERFDSIDGGATVATGSGGRFEAVGLLPGRYRLTGVPPAISEHRWLAPAEPSFVEIQSSTRETRVELAWIAAGRISAAGRSALEVVDLSGRVLARRTGSGTSAEPLRLDAVVPPGSYVVRRTAPNEPPEERRVEVQAGRRAAVDLRSP